MKKLIGLFMVGLLVFPALLFSSTEQYDFPDDMPEIEDMDAFKQCLCWHSCNERVYCSRMSCTYAPEPSSSSPNCADLSNGVCKCSGFGCSRTPMIIDGEIYEECFSRHGPMVIGDGNCETHKGENCYISPDDCACGADEVCDPVLASSDDGCYEIGTNPCPEGAEVSTKTGRCECEDPDWLFTEQGCVAECPSDATYSEAERTCLCDSVAYEFDAESDACVAKEECPPNATMSEDDRCVCDDGFRPNKSQRHCVADISDEARFHLIMEKYEANIPSGNKLAPFEILHGPVNNLFSVVNEDYGEFTCGGYQDMVLALLDGLRFSDDPEERALVENFDYGPVGAWGNWHQAVAIYPTGATWTEESIILDPWPKQRPVAYTIEEWTVLFSGGSQQGIAPSVADDAAKNYPTIGGTYSNPNTLKLTEEETKALFETFTEEQKKEFRRMELHERDSFIRRQREQEKTRVYINSPVAVYLTNQAGDKLGMDASGAEFTDYEDAFFTMTKLDNDTYSTGFYLPQNDYELNLEATGTGEVKMLVGFWEEDGSYDAQKTSFAVNEGEEIGLALSNDDNKITTSEAETTIDFIAVDSEADLVDFTADLPGIYDATTVTDYEAWAVENWQEIFTEMVEEESDFNWSLIIAVMAGAMVGFIGVKLWKK